MTNRVLCKILAYFFRQFAQWSETNGLEVVAAKYNRVPQETSARSVQNGTYIVTSILVSKSITIARMSGETMTYFANNRRNLT